MKIYKVSAIPIVEISAEKLAKTYVLRKTKLQETYVLHLPSAEELLLEVLKNEDDFLSPFDKRVEGIRVFKGEDEYCVLDIVEGFKDKRSFKTAEECFGYLLPLFRRFLSHWFCQHSYVLPIAVQNYGFTLKSWFLNFSLQPCRTQKPPFLPFKYKSLVGTKLQGF